MSSPRSPRRAIRFVIILVLCFGALSWSSSQYFTSPDPASISIKEKQPAALFELSDALESTRNASWYNDTSTRHEHRPDLNIRQTVPEFSFIQRLQIYETQGHNTTSLLQLQSTLPLASNSSTITTIIHAIDTQSLRMQLDALATQTAQIHTVWIICTAKLQPAAEQYAQKRRTSSMTILVINANDMKSAMDSFPARSAGATPWIPLLALVETDYVWILEDGVTPNPDYLKTVHDLLQTNEYKDALLGTHATLLPSNINVQDTKLARSRLHCLPAAFHFLPKRTQPVDMIHHVWFLRRSWIPSLLVDRRRDAMESPLAYYISQSLLSYAAIPSIVVPPPSMSATSLITNANATKPLLFIQNLPSSASCTNTIPAAYQQSKPWKRILALKSNPTALDQQQRSLMTSYETPKLLFLIDGPTEAKAFLPLLCRFAGPPGDDDSQQGAIHVAVTGKQQGLSGSLLSTLLKKTPECHVNAVIHDLDLYNAQAPAIAATRTALLLSRLIQALQPRILFHIQQNSPMFHSIDTLAKSHHLSVIQLPINDIQHALWIPKLPVEALQYWNQINIELVVITDRRPHSLSRLFNSIGHGNYLGDKVDLTIHMEQSADRVTRMFVNSFPWLHGTKQIRHRIRKGGLMPAIIESWYPSDNDNYGVILEDDIELSPLFYIWIKYNILHYRYSRTNSESYQWIYGISLYSPRNLELMPEGRIAFDPNDVLLPQNFLPRTPYGSQVPCSWGAVYFPEHWREFHQYLTSRLLDLQAKPPRLNIHVPNSRSERWKKSWKKYFIEMVYLRAYVMVYPNFQDFESFSTNHLEFGTHIKHDRAQTALDSFVVPLMQRDTLISQLPNHQLPNFDQLPMMDLWGHLMPHKEMDAIAANWHQKVSACTRRQPHQRFSPQDLLCPFPLSSSSNDSQATTISPTKKKQIKTVLTRHMLEHVEYVTVHYDDQQDQEMKGDMNVWDDMPEPLDVATMTTSASDHEHEDDEYRDLEENWASLQEFTKQIA